MYSFLLLISAKQLFHLSEGPACFCQPPLGLTSFNTLDFLALKDFFVLEEIKSLSISAGNEKDIESTFNSMESSNFLSL